MNSLRRFSTSVAKLLTWGIKGTTEDVSEAAVIVEHAIKQSEPHRPLLDKFTVATVKGNPHVTKNYDGTIDPKHVSFDFSKTAKLEGKKLAAHYYPDTCTIKFNQENMADIVLTKEAIAEAKPYAAANPVVFQDWKKGFSVVWDETQWVRAV